MSFPEWISDDGRIRLICADCLEVLPTLEAGSVDAVVTDPPYNVGLNYSDGDNRADYPEWCGEWLEHTRRASSGAVMISCGVANLSLWPKSDWTFAWVKRNSIKRIATGWNTWEPVLVFGKIKGKKTHDSFLVPVNPQPDTGCHPCPKPVGWAIELIDRATMPEMEVLDPFAGSFTTAIACIRTDRRCIAIEKERKYFDIGVERCKAEYARTALFDGACA